MATEWGNNTIGAGQLQGWAFSLPTEPGLLPVISVRPLTPSFNGDGSFHWSISPTSLSFPTEAQLGVSTLWSQMSNDQRTITYYLLVMNFSRATVSYAFVESNL
ncbi:hypothetical protein [Paraburkholderia sp. BCC1884]|uniref:hypothetical protein n=1 Tax=Paraburkholderia sp. BCC1884 TaxID=2562668 RepID=UPI001183A1C8|nr:hypothetical protein [Paraburkholderia sp. BCC1884]